MTNYLNRVPVQFQAACAGFLVASYQAMETKATHRFGFSLMPELESDEEFLAHLYSSPLAEQLSLVAQAAGQTLDRDNLDLWSEVHDALLSILTDLFLPPGADTITYEVPEWYWETDIGQVLALANIWLDRDQLVTIAEAAQIEGVPLSTIASRVNRGRLTSFPDPRAANPQKGARLVMRSDLTPKA